jgi:hypothetical protein
MYSTFKNPFLTMALFNSTPLLTSNLISLSVEAALENI